MKQINRVLLALTTAVSLGGGAVSCSGADPAIEFHRPGKKLVPALEDPSEFTLHRKVLDITDEGYVPVIQYVLESSYTLETLPPDKNIAFILHDTLGAPGAELANLAAVGFGPGKHMQAANSENRIERLTPKSWRIVLSHESMVSLLAEPGLTERSFTLSYSIPKSELTNIFATDFGLKATYASDKQRVTIGQVVIAFSEGLRPNWKEKQESNVKFVRDRFRNFQNEMFSDRHLSGEKKLTVGGQRVGVKYQVTVEPENLCVVKVKVAAILDEEHVGSGVRTTYGSSREKEIRSNCGVVGDYLVVENVGRVSIPQNIREGERHSFTGTFKTETLKDDVLGVYTALRPQSEISFPFDVMLGSR